MVEHQSCAGLVNTSALCAIEQEVKGESNVNAISLAEISAELQRERQKNAELMERISALEAQIKERDKEAFLTNGQGSCPSGVERSVKKFKRQKTGTVPNGAQRGHEAHGEMASQIKNDSSFIFPKCTNAKDHLVNWMSLEAELSHVDKLKDDDFVAEFDDTDDTDDEEEFEDAPTNTNTENKIGPSCLETHLYEDGYNATTSRPSLGSFFNGRIEETWLYKNQETTCNKEDHLNKNGGEEACRELAVHKTAADGPVSWKEADHTGIGSISHVRKPPKMAFCPKEVKRILESEALLQKNAQSHTIRKVIIFASLGIRHGIDDMYELDFNHFSILRKGEPYVSPTDPGEHVLYENPGVRRRIFYPNLKNLTLCPVQILEEEKAMRPSDPSCPSCLFLCIKYGGRTRNLPQNEYVRQRMGRNKLKSFGPVICRMAMLVYIRSGSFFFKALGITLLFMAGFPDDLVQRETKYRNLDLLQKYYRTDKDAEGEELFLPLPITCESEATPGSEKLRWKTSTSKPKAKRQLNPASKPPALQKSAIQQTAPSNSTVSTQFGLLGYTSSQSHGMAAIQSMPSQTPEDNLQGRNHMISRPGTVVSYQNQAQYNMFPPQSANTFIPMMYWSAPNPFPPTPFASTYGYQSFPSTASYFTLHPQPQAYYGNPSCSSVIPRAVERNGKICMTLEEADSDSETSSSNTEAKAAPGDCK